MALTVSPGYTDTVIAEFAALNLVAPAINWAEDFRLLPNGGSTNEVVVLNTTSPRDQQESFRFAQRKVNNIYAGSADIDPSAYLVNRQGTSTLVECREVFKQTSTIDDGYVKFAPARCGISFTLPVGAEITAEMALNLILRTVAACFEQSDNTAAGVSALLRGIMVKDAL